MRLPRSPKRRGLCDIYRRAGFSSVLTLTGLQGAFFAPLALSYIVAIMASLAVALTVTPALSLLFFAKGVHGAAETRLQKGLKKVYRAALGLVSRWPRTAMFVALAICAGALFLLPRLGDDFLPEFREGHFVLRCRRPGTPGGNPPSWRPHFRTIAQIRGIATVSPQGQPRRTGRGHLEAQPLRIPR